MKKHIRNIIIVLLLALVAVSVLADDPTVYITRTGAKYYVGTLKDCRSAGPRNELETEGGVGLPSERGYGPPRKMPHGECGDQWEGEGGSR